MIERFFSASLTTLVVVMWAWSLFRGVRHLLGGQVKQPSVDPAPGLKTTPNPAGLSKRRMMMKWHSITWLLCAALLSATAAAPEKLQYTIDATKSKLELNVYREGAFKFLGHDHLVAAQGVSGTVQLDPATIERSSVSLKVDTSSLRVLDPSVSEKERHEVQATMEGEKVLDAERYPEITFTSTNVSEVKTAGGGYELTLSGELRLHGVVKTIRLPVRVSLEGRELRVQGETPLRQTDYQITPVRVGGGTVKVKDQLKLSFEIVALK